MPSLQDNWTIVNAGWGAAAMDREGETVSEGDGLSQTMRTFLRDNPIETRYQNAMTLLASNRLLALFAVFSLFATSGCETIDRAHYSYKRTKNHATDPGYTPPSPAQVPPAVGQSPSAPALPTQ